MVRPRLEQHHSSIPTLTQQQCQAARASQLKMMEASGQVALSQNRTRETVRHSKTLELVHVSLVKTQFKSQLLQGWQLQSQ